MVQIWFTGRLEWTIVAQYLKPCHYFLRDTVKEKQVYLKKAPPPHLVRAWKL